MNRKNCKWLSLVLSFLLTFSMMGAALAEMTPAGELPVVKEGTDITLTVGVMQTPFIENYKTNYFTRYIEEKTGVKLEFIEYPQDPPGEKVLLTLATNDVKSLPDMFLSIMMASNNTIFGASYAQTWYDQGMIIPLNDLIENYGVNTKEALALAEGYGYQIKNWMTSPDGNIYSLPSFSASLTNSYPHKLWLNQGWLDKLNLKMPTTTEEFREVLRAFKTGDPNGNGQADEIPFSGAKQLLYYGYDFLINAFIYNDSYNSRMYVEEGTVKFAPTTKQWRDAMIYLRELNNEGLYYPGSFTQDTTTIQQMATNENDILGAFEGLGHDLVVVTDNQDIIDRYNSVPALTGPEGNHFVTFAAPAIRPSGVITTNCEHPEIAFRVLDAMMSWEAAVITRYGEKGVNWDDADENTEGYYSTPAILKILENTWAAAGQNQNFLQQSPFILDPAIATGIQWSGNPKEAGYIKAQSVVKLQETGVVPQEYLSNLVFTVEESEAISTIRNDVDTYILQSIANFVAGGWDPTDDRQWETYIAEYERMGLPTYISCVQQAYTRMSGQ